MCDRALVGCVFCMILLTKVSQGGYIVIPLIVLKMRDLRDLADQGLARFNRYTALSARPARPFYTFYCKIKKNIIIYFFQYSRKHPP